MEGLSRWTKIIRTKHRERSQIGFWKNNTQKANYSNRYGSIFTTSILHKSLQQFLRILIKKKTDKRNKRWRRSRGLAWILYEQLHSIISTYGKITIPYISTIIKFCSWKKLYRKKQKTKTHRKFLQNCIKWLAEPATKSNKTGPVIASAQTQRPL